MGCAFWVYQHVYLVYISAYTTQRYCDDDYDDSGDGDDDDDDDDNDDDDDDDDDDDNDDDFHWCSWKYKYYLHCFISKKYFIVLSSVVL